MRLAFRRLSSLQQRVTLLNPLLPLPQLLPSVVLPAEVRRETGLADATACRRRRRPRRPTWLVAVLQPASLALPQMHFTEVEVTREMVSSTRVCNNVCDCYL